MRTFARTLVALALVAGIVALSGCASKAPNPGELEGTWLLVA